MSLKELKIKYPQLLGQEIKPLNREEFVANDKYPRQGVYAWYFNTLPSPEGKPSPISEFVPLETLHRVEPYGYLLYIGISESNLKTRTRRHFFRTARVSTLRKSIGVSLGYRLQKVGDKKIFSPDDEEGINKWMAVHARVCHMLVEHALVVIAEKELIQEKELTLPFNIEHNEHSTFRKQLLKLRGVI